MDAEQRMGEDDALDDVFRSDRDRSGNDAPLSDEPSPTKAEAEVPTLDGSEGTTEPVDGNDTESPGRDPATGRFVPVSELVAERKKHQERAANEARLREEAERRAAQYEQQLRQLHQQQRQQPPVQPPDPYDPEAVYAYQQQQMLTVQQQMSEAMVNMRLDISEDAARQQYGDDAVDAALRAATEQGLTGMNSPFMQQRNPYGALLQWHRSQQALAQIGPDPEAFKKKVREEILAELKSGKGPGNAAPPQRLPGTLADATASGAQGGHLSDEAMMSSVFASDRKRGFA